MITEKSNRLQVIMITDNDYPNSDFYCGSFYVFVLSCVCCVFVRVCLCVLCEGLTSWLSFVVSTVSLSLSHWYPGSGVVLDCIDS